MPDYETATSVPPYAELGAAYHYPAWVHGALPCLCRCVPTASVVYQNASATHSLRGFTSDGKYWRKLVYYDDWASTTVLTSGNPSLGYCGTDERVAVTTGGRGNTRRLVNDRASLDARTEIVYDISTTTTASLTGTCTNEEDEEVTVTGEYSRVTTPTLTVSPLFPEEGGFLPSNTYGGYTHVEVDESINCGSCYDGGSGQPCGESCAEDDYDLFKSWFSYGSGVSDSTYSDEFTWEDLTALVDDDLTANVFLEIGEAHSVSREFSPRIYQHQYVIATENRGDDDEFADPSWELDTTAFNAAVDARIATAEADLASAEASEIAGAALLSSAEDDLEDAEEAVTSLEAQLASEIAELDTQRALAQLKATELAAVKHQLEFDVLTEAQESALEDERDTLNAELIALYTTYPEGMEMSEYGTTVTHNDLLDARSAVKAKSVLVDYYTDRLTLYTANVAQQTARVADAESNDDSLWLEYAFGGIGSSYHSAGSTSLTKRKARYRMEISLTAYDIKEATSLTISWRERTWQSHNRDSGVSAAETYTYVEKSETVSALPGATSVATAWYTLPPPANPDYTSIVVGVQTTSTASLDVEYEGGTAHKVGIYSYGPTDPPAIYRKEDISGGVDTCVASGEPSKDYTSYRYYDPNSSSYSADLIAASSLTAWPLGTILQPAIGSPVTGVKPATPTTETETTREFIRQLYCGSDIITENLSLELTEEYTTAELQAEVDNLLTDENWGSDDSEFELPEAIGDAPYAVNFLHPNELTYHRTRFRYKLAGQLPTNTFEDRDEVFTLTKKTLTIATGVISSEDVSVTLSYDENTNYKRQSEWTTVEAASGTVVWLEVGTGESRPEYEGSITVEPPTPISL